MLGSKFYGSILETMHTKFGILFCGAIPRGLIGLLISRLYHFIGVSIPFHIPLIVSEYHDHNEKYGAERWGPAEICQNLSVPIVSQVN